MKIPLPRITSLPNSTAHSYPFQIAFRAQRFLAGSIFYYAFVDAAVGQYMRLGPQSLENIKAAFTQIGLAERAWEVNWSSFEAYKDRKNFAVSL